MLFEYARDRVRWIFPRRCRSLNLFINERRDRAKKINARNEI